MMHTTLAYKFVMTAAIIGFVNHYAPRLHLPIDVPIKQKDIQRFGVSPAECDKVLTHYGGGIRVNNYGFGFSDGTFNDPDLPYTGYFVITKLEDDGMKSFGIPMLYLRESSSSLMERASRMKYTVNTNDLYRISTNYLVALEVDLNAFQKMNPFAIDTGYFYSDRGPVPPPILDTYWGKPALRSPGASGMSFEVSAVTGQLLELNMGNKSGCKDLPLLKDLDKLLAVSDAEFLKLSDAERTDLIHRFTVNSNYALDAVATEAFINPQTNQITAPNAPAKSP